jgi:hypothetical protein
MNTELPLEAVEFERVLSSSLMATGGFDHVQRAEQDLDHRIWIGDHLGALGLWDIDVSQETQVEAAALACRAAGRIALPYPVAERLAAQGLDGTDAVGLVAYDKGRLAHADLPMRWTAVSLDGRTAPVVRAGGSGRRNLGPFVCGIETGPWDSETDAGPLLLVLQCWTLLGMLQSAQAMTVNYVRDRRQFGQTLAEFQSVQFALTDVAVATQGLEELSKYTTWAIANRPEEALTDALALRSASLEAAEATFRISHQLHGAIGFCDESDLSWLSRHSQALRRLPLGRPQTEAALVHLIARTGFYTPVTTGARASSCT